MESYYPELDLVNSENFKDYLPPNKRQQKFCQCGTKINYNFTWCYSCVPRKTKIKWPPIDDLRKQLKNSNYSVLGKKLGVSDNAIRKHIKKHSNTE